MDCQNIPVKHEDITLKIEWVDKIVTVPKHSDCITGKICKLIFHVDGDILRTTEHFIVKILDIEIQCTG